MSLSPATATPTVVITRFACALSSGDSYTFSTSRKEKSCSAPGAISKMALKNATPLSSRFASTIFHVSCTLVFLTTSSCTLRLFFASKLGRLALLSTRSRGANAASSARLSSRISFHQFTFASLFRCEGRLSSRTASSPSTRISPLTDSSRSFTAASSAEPTNRFPRRLSPFMERVEHPKCNARSSPRATPPCSLMAGMNGLIDAIICSHALLAFCSVFCPSVSGEAKSSPVWKSPSQKKQMSASPANSRTSPPFSTARCTSTSKMACRVSPNSSIPSLPLVLRLISRLVNPEMSTTTATPVRGSLSKGTGRSASSASWRRTRRERKGRSSVACSGVR